MRCESNRHLIHRIACRCFRLRFPESVFGEGFGTHV